MQALGCFIVFVEFRPNGAIPLFHQFGCHGLLRIRHFIIGRCPLHQRAPVYRSLRLLVCLCLLGVKLAFQPRLFVQRGLKRRRIAAGRVFRPGSPKVCYFQAHVCQRLLGLLNGRLRLMAAALPGLGGLRLLPGLRLLGNFPQAILPRQGRDGGMAEVLEHLARREDLTADMASRSFGALMDGRLTPAQAGSFLMGLRMKGESSLELAHATRAALARAVRVEGISGPCIDVVGTGGDGRHSFNCSTATSLVLAGMGYKVVKHGNRAVSSTCGSADALESLGIPLDTDPAAVADMVAKRNFAFLFAPHFHPAFKNIGPLRKELGVRTLFNLLGPMINPARPSHLLMGVARPELVPLLADTLSQSALYRAAVVCGAGNYDELTPMGPATAMLLHNGSVRPLELDPADFGFQSCTPEDLAVESREEAVAVLRRLLDGEGPRPMRDMVALNVGLAIFLMEEGMPLDVCMARAREAVRAGLGRRVLHAA